MTLIRRNLGLSLQQRIDLDVFDAHRSDDIPPAP
jgi:hypothetical protein